MQTPFERLDPAVMSRSLRIMAVLTVLATLGMAFVDTHYKTVAAPYGIVSFEVAGTPMLAQWILDTWSREVGMNSWVAFGLGVDYLYLVIYGVTFTLVAATIASRLAPISPAAAKVARFVAILQIVAPLCDAVENAALMAMLTRAGTDPWAAVAAGFALTKFACLSACVTLALVAVPVIWRHGRTVAPATA
jgi:hypothetical protein